MKYLFYISIFCLVTSAAYSQNRSIDLFETTVAVPAAPAAPAFNAVLSNESITAYVNQMDAAAYQPFLNILLQYKKEHHPDDWLYYQAIRRMAQYLSPKSENYYRYTFFKWWLLTNSGYKSILTYSHPYLLFYVRSDETVYNIPNRNYNGEQYICLNYHDYGSIDFEKYKFTEASLALNEGSSAFSYRVTNLPEFRQSDYAEKKVEFTDGTNRYSFRIKINQQVNAIFNNYPVVDYDLQFNMPISKTTYESLIPSLKKYVRGMKQKEGVEFLMQFTRYAFLFKPDVEVFGSEKRLSPEQTLLAEFSDCEDRAALFFFLVKEIYDLPMLVLTYPQHVTVAVQFKKPYGSTIEYGGLKYSVCEPSPQNTDLRAGDLLPDLKKQHYSIAYVYRPAQK